MRLLVLASLVLAPLTASADPVEFKPYRDPRSVDTRALDAEQGLAKLQVAIRQRDARAIQRQLATTVYFDGAWFADTACRKRFARSEILDSTGSRAALAKCLAGVKLQLSTRRAASERDGVLTIDPGIELELTFDGERVRWMRFAGQRSVDALLPTLTAQAFEALRTAGSTHVDAVLAKLLDGTVQRAGSASAWLRVCLDAKGTVTSTTVRERAPDLDLVETAFLGAVRDWKFRPFAPAGVATPACSLALLTYPAIKAPDTEVLPASGSSTKLIMRDVDAEEGDEWGEGGGVPGGTVGGPPPPPPPPPPPAQRVVPPAALEALRIAGTKQVVPDAPTQKTIAKAGKSRVVGVYKVCVSDTGRVILASQLKSTGFAAYDQQILSEINGWRFRPYQHNGNATAVCTSATFIHSTTP